MVQDNSFHWSLPVARFLLGITFVMFSGPSTTTAQTLTEDQLGDGLSISVWNPHAQCPDVAPLVAVEIDPDRDRKSTRLNSSHIQKSRMPSSA